MKYCVNHNINKFKFIITSVKKIIKKNKNKNKN